LESVKTCADEIILVDSFSEDNTCEIAENFGAKVVKQSFLGYVEQKNFALAQAHFPWILSLDADEAIDARLAQEILEIKASQKLDKAFIINRLNSYAGQWIHHGAWNPDWKIRLFPKNKGCWKGLNPHDKYEPFPEIETIELKGKILHWSYDSVRSHQEKIQKFARIGAEAYFKAGKKPFVGNAIFSAGFRFFRDYFLKLGFLDGKAGFTIAWLTAKEVHLKYQMLHRLWEKNG
jgi:glycosyltransferase involved in cell wall biosynthesis